MICRETPDGRQQIRANPERRHRLGLDVQIVHYREIETRQTCIALLSSFDEGDRKPNFNLRAREYPIGDLGLESQVVNAAIRPLQPDGCQFQLKSMTFGDVCILYLDGASAIGIVKIGLRGNAGGAPGGNK